MMAPENLGKSGEIKCVFLQKLRNSDEVLRPADPQADRYKVLCPQNARPHRPLGLVDLPASQVEPQRRCWYVWYAFGGRMFAHASLRSCALSSCSESNRSKYAMVLIRPSLTAMCGFQLSKSCAREMSGWRCFGSFSGRGRRTTREREPTNSITIWASSMILNSVGLPIFAGPVTSAGVAISRTKPS